MAHAAGSDSKSSSTTKNAPSANASVKAASPTTSVRSNTADVSTGHTANYQPTPSIGGNSGSGGGSGGLSAAGAGKIEDYTPQGRSDPVDATSKPSWMQFQDFLDTMTPVTSATGPKTFQLQQYPDNATIPYLATGPGYGPPQDTKQSRVARLPSQVPLTTGVMPIAPEGYSAVDQIPGDASSREPAVTAIDAALSGVPLPQRDPRGYSDLFATDGQMLSPDGQVLQVGSPSATNSISGAAKPSMWDSVIDNTGKLLSHTGLGGIVSTMFPDIWNGAGTSIKNLLDNGGAQTKYPDDMATALAGLAGGSQSNGNGQAASAIADFVDLNHNGIDDKIEGYVPPVGVTPAGIGQFASTRDVSFPTSPPYRPGVDPEWTYFRDHLARGGVVGYADGGLAGVQVPLPRPNPMLSPGNLDLDTRKVYHGSDGSYRTENSISIGTDSGEVLIPTVVNGKQLSNDAAIAHYKKTGENLGTFATPEDADNYAEQLHLRQANKYAGADGEGYSQGGVVKMLDGRDPRVMMIADAEDALHRGDHQHPSLDKFVDTFGPKALENLHTNVRAGYRMRAGGVVQGPGGPTDDAVPAVIDGQHPARLSSGEFVMPVAAVEAIGGGDHDTGVQKLQALIEALSNKEETVTDQNFVSDPFHWNNAQWLDANHHVPPVMGQQGMDNLKWKYSGLHDIMKNLGGVQLNWRGRPESSNVEDRTK